MSIAIDLFAGAGGLAEGLQAAGIQVVAAVELHPQPSLTYVFNHPLTKVIVGDIRMLSMNVLAESIKQRIGNQRVDLIVGGPPCQGFSTAGRKIATDPRNDLFLQFIRVVAHFRPRMFLLENVPGFRKMHDGQAYTQAIEQFTALGYTVCDTILSAAQYGVPQRRQRFVMAGRLCEETRPFEWPRPTHANENVVHHTLFEEPIMPYVRVFDALEDIAFLEPGWESHKYQSAPQSEYQYIRRSNNCDLLFNHLATQHRPKAVEMFSYIPEGSTISSVPLQLRSGKRTMARLDRKEISNTVLAMPDDLIHYSHDRIPTVREMARLQSFDDDYVFFGKRTSGFVERRVDVPQYTQVGNAVPPLLGYALGKALLTSLGEDAQEKRLLDIRHQRRLWVRGSSGYAGYTLGSEAEQELDIVDIYGNPLPLPICEQDCPVYEMKALYRWSTLPNPMRGQWSPNVVARKVPVYIEEVVTS